MRSETEIEVVDYPTQPLMSFVRIQSQLSMQVVIKLSQPFSFIWCRALARRSQRGGMGQSRKVSCLENALDERYHPHEDANIVRPFIRFTQNCIARHAMRLSTHENPTVARRLLAVAS